MRKGGSVQRLQLSAQDKLEEARLPGQKQEFFKLAFHPHTAAASRDVNDESISNGIHGCKKVCNQFLSIHSMLAILEWRHGSHYNIRANRFCGRRRHVWQAVGWVQ
ncbi:unnamed protein product [Urochloa humidicola]